MKAQYQVIAVSSLRQRCDVLQDAVATLAGGGQAIVHSDLLQTAATTADLSSNFVLLADQMLANRNRPLKERAAAALRAMSASVRASHGALGLVDEEEMTVVATTDDRPVRRQLEACMTQCVQAELGEQDTVVGKDLNSEQALSTHSFEDEGIVYGSSHFIKPAIAAPRSLALLRSAASSARRPFARQSWYAWCAIF